MNATAAHRPQQPIDETVPYRGGDDSERGGGRPTGFSAMRGAPGAASASASAAGRPASRFAYSSGDRPLDGYTIKRGVGRGGFGEVYYAVSDSGREVALKLILRNLEIERRGVVQCMNLKHPNLLTIFDLKANDEGDVFVVMEYVAGSSLADVLRGNPRGMPIDEVRHWLKGLVEGVAYLHDHGVVHRDLKPANLFMEGGIVKIGDYGLAKLITAGQGSEHSESIGTCQYMAPEIGSGKYSRAIDVYAVGVILHEMLTGRVPFDGETVNEILMKHLTARPDVSALPEPYRAIIAAALEKDPNRRPARIHDLLPPGDAPKTPDIRVIGAKGAAEEVHRIEAEEPVFYIGPDTMPPRPSLQDRMKADWRRMRDRKAKSRRRPPGPAAGFVRAVAENAAVAPPSAVRRGEAPPPPPPPATTGRARVAEAAASMLWAAPLVGLLVAPAVGLLGIDPVREGAHVVFLYGVALLTTWTALLSSKVLEAREVDPTGRRVAAAMVGAAVGGGAWLLARGLMLGGGEILYAPLYFAGLFGATSAWYGQTVRDRRRRIGLVPIAWTLLAAAVLSPLWLADPGEGAAVAAIVAVAVPLVSPWNERAARYSEYVKKLDKAAGRSRTA
jgi:hypothetical protein